MPKKIHTESGDIRVGISGWRYVPWRGSFYPKGLHQRQELHFASRAVNSIELNGSFYGSQTPERYANWYADTPDDFVFSVKAPRFITHIKRLKDIEVPMANFWATGLFELKEKLGPVLWQFPPTFKFDAALFKDFFELLPFTSDAAKRLVQQCDSTAEKAEDLHFPAHLPLRHAIEIRNESFENPNFIALLREYNVALVVADNAGKWPCIEDLTADFSYLRLHGDKELYASGYDEAALERWCKRIKLWREGKQPDDAQIVAESEHKKESKKSTASTLRNVYCYFDNDTKVRAPYDARRLLEKLNLADDLAVTPGVLPESDF